MHLKVGSTILVPKSAQSIDKDITPELADSATMAVEPETPSTRRISVKVGKHDSLASIAKRNKVSVAQIKAWNDLQQDKVASGQTLKLDLPYKVASAKRSGNSNRQVAHSGYAVRVKAGARGGHHQGKTVLASTKNGKKRRV